MACSADGSNEIPKRHKNLTDVQYSNWERKKRQTFYNVNSTPNWQLATFSALSKSVCTCVSDWLTSWHTHTARQIALRANLFALPSIHCERLRVFVRHVAAIAEIGIVIRTQRRTNIEWNQNRNAALCSATTENTAQFLCCGWKSRRCRRRPDYYDISMVSAMWKMKWKCCCQPIYLNQGLWRCRCYCLRRDHFSHSRKRVSDLKLCDAFSFLPKRQCRWNCIFRLKIPSEKIQQLCVCVLLLHRWGFASLARAHTHSSRLHRFASSVCVYLPQVCRSSSHEHQ